MDTTSNNPITPAKGMVLFFENLKTMKYNKMEIIKELIKKSSKSMVWNKDVNANSITMSPNPIYLFRTSLNSTPLNLKVRTRNPQRSMMTTILTKTNCK